MYFPNIGLFLNKIIIIIIIYTHISTLSIESFVLIQRPMATQQLVDMGHLLLELALSR